MSMLMHWQYFGALGLAVHYGQYPVSYWGIFGCTQALSPDGVSTQQEYAMDIDSGL